MIKQFLISLFSQTVRPIEREAQIITPLEKLKSDNKPLSKYEDDVKALLEKYGEFITGLCIETTLQELLKTCPRRRARIEAYQGLKSYLQHKYGVNLIIKSRKTK